MIINKDDVYCTPVYKEDHNGGKFEWEIKSRGLFKKFSFQKCFDVLKSSGSRARMSMHGLYILIHKMNEKGLERERVCVCQWAGDDQKGRKAIGTP